MSCIFRRQHNSNTAPRYVNPFPKPVVIEPTDEGSVTIDDDVIDVEQVVLKEKCAPKLPDEKFKIQMVLLQRKTRSRNSTQNVPHLLEIHTNCNWDGPRCVYVCFKAL